MVSEMAREMKDSGIEWIGEIPVEWKVLNLKYLGNTKSGLGNKKPQDFGHGYPFISYKNIYSNFSIEENYEDKVASTDIDREKYNVLRGDAFFTGSSETIEELGMASMCLKDIPDATYNGFSIRFRPNNLNEYIPEFMMYYFRSLATREHLVRNDNSITRANLSQKTLKMLPVLLPNFKEQVLLANYLDQKVTKINSIIEKTKQSIEEYKKYKQSLITEVVTKGLDPNVKMKDSGIEWIGEIPEHWEIISLGLIFEYIGGYAYHSSDFTIDETNNQILRIGNVKNDKLILNDKKVFISDDIANKSNKVKVQEEDLIFTMTGTKGKRDYFYTVLFENSMSDKSLFINQRVGCLRAKMDISVKYYSYLLKDIKILDSIFIYETGTANQGNLGIESIKRTKLHFPPIHEQKEIIDFLNEKTKFINKIIEKKVKLVEELESYKKSFIYEVVTGKKEVS